MEWITPISEKHSKEQECKYFQLQINFALISEETDKVYFRKKDEIVNYAEAYVKCRDTLRKVW